jgi:hypothetical protein
MIPSSVMPGSFKQASFTSHIIEISLIIATNNLRDFSGSELTLPHLQILNPHQIIAE